MTWHRFISRDEIDPSTWRTVATALAEARDVPATAMHIEIGQENHGYQLRQGTWS